MSILLPEGSLSSDPIVRDGKNFMWRVHKELGYIPPTPLQYDFMDYLQEHVDEDREVGDRKELMAFRGVAKTHVTTIYGVWRLKRNRREIVLITSATRGHASNIATFAWQMITKFPFLADMKPSPDQRRSAIAFDVAGCPPARKEESFAAIGIMGQVTGRRFTVGIGDDLETPNTSDTEGARAELRRRMGELTPVVMPRGDIYLLGTAQTEDTVYREYAEEKGYELRIYPVYYPVPSPDPKLDELVKYGPRLAPMIANALAANPELAGTSTEPTRFTELDILQRRKEWGRTEFDRQFKMFLDAGLGKGNPLKLRDLIVMEIAPPRPSDPEFRLPSELVFNPMPAHRWDIAVDSLTGDSHLYAPADADIYVPAEQVACIIDPSGEGKDETTWTIGAGLLGRVFALYQGADTEGFTAGVMKKIAADCKRWRVTTIVIESNFGQGMFGELLQPHLADINHQCEIVEEVAGRTSKEKRIVGTLEPLITDHRMVISADLLRKDFEVDYEDVEAAKRRYHRLTYQYTRMTTQKGCVPFDDRVDGLAGLGKFFIGVLTRQLAKAQQEGKVRSIELEAEAMIEMRKAQGLPLFGLDRKVHHLGRPTPRQRKR